jgi:phosphate transport system protein
VEALKKRDLESAQRIYDNDERINEKRFEIENDCIITIATQQPLARDLRVLASILEIIADLERMGDYAKGIANICLKIGKEPPLKPLIDIPRMAEIAASMLHRALTAFVNCDLDLALSIPRDDDIVDDLYNQVHRELVTFMIADPSTIQRADYLLWVAHNLERMADRVTNICERVYFVAHAELLEMNAIFAKVEQQKQQNI